MVTFIPGPFGSPVLTRCPAVGTTRCVFYVSHPWHSHRVRASLGPSVPSSPLVCWVLPPAARGPMWGRLHPVLALYPLERGPRTSASHPGPGRRRVSGW